MFITVYKIFENKKLGVMKVVRIRFTSSFNGMDIYRLLMA